MIQHFTDLLVWQQAHKLLLQTYQVTDSFPAKEQFGMTSQMRRAALSITSNIAEGFGRRGPKDQERFYIMAYGSLTELENQIIASKDLGFIPEEAHQNMVKLVTQTAQLLNGLLRAHKNKH